MHAVPMKGARRRRWVDTRLLTGLGLVAASVAGVIAVVSSADRTVTVFVAAQTLTVGSDVREQQLVPTEVRLPDASARYLTPDQLPSGGLVATRTVGAGELVPVAAVGDRSRSNLVAVVVPVAGALPGNVVEGSIVDLWAAVDGEEAPEVVAADATLVAATQGDGMIGAGRTVTVELLVDHDRVADVLAATAAGSAFSLVATSNALER